MLLQNHLACINSAQRRAEATMTLGTFVAKQFEPDILATLKRQAVDQLESQLFPNVPKFAATALPLVA